MTRKRLLATVVVAAGVLVLVLVGGHLSADAAARSFTRELAVPRQDLLPPLRAEAAKTPVSAKLVLERNETPEELARITWRCDRRRAAVGALTTALGRLQLDRSPFAFLSTSYRHTQDTSASLSRVGDRLNRIAGREAHFCAYYVADVAADAAVNAIEPAQRRIRVFDDRCTDADGCLRPEDVDRYIPLEERMVAATKARYELSTRAGCPLEGSHALCDALTAYYRSSYLYHRDYLAILKRHGDYDSVAVAGRAGTAAARHALTAAAKAYAPTSAVIGAYPVAAALRDQQLRNEWALAEALAALDRKLARGMSGP
jgi:hypothetical protein